MSGLEVSWERSIGGSRVAVWLGGFTCEWDDDGYGKWEMGVHGQAWHSLHLQTYKYDIIRKLHKLSQCHNLCWMCI